MAKKNDVLKIRALKYVIELLTKEKARQDRVTRLDIEEKSRARINVLRMSHRISAADEIPTEEDLACIQEALAIPLEPTGSEVKSDVLKEAIARLETEKKMLEEQPNPDRINNLVVCIKEAIENPRELSESEANVMVLDSTLNLLKEQLNQLDASSMSPKEYIKGKVVACGTPLAPTLNVKANAGKKKQTKTTLVNR